MPDEVTPPAEGQAQVETPVATVPASLVAADGSLVDNWQSHAPEGYEDLREDASLKTFKNAFALAKSYVHVRKQVPMDKMPRPNESWGDSDWEEFHKAGGRPETAGDYGITRHELLTEADLPQASMDEYQNILFKHGASKGLVDALEEWNGNQLTRQKEQGEAATTEFNTRLWDSLHDKWGAAYDQKVGRGTRAIERGANGDEGFHQRVLDKVNKDADLIEFMANMEDKFSEHDPIERQDIPTPSDLQGQIDTIQNSADMKSTVKSTRMNAVTKIMRLRDQMAKDKQTA